MKKINSTLKSSEVVAFISLVFILVLLQNTSLFQKSLPLIIFYVILVYNTFFSIKFFSSITPVKNKTQWIIDFIILSVYVLMALNIENYKFFIFLTFILFAVATLKYIFLIAIVRYKKVVRRKMYADALGDLLCLFTFVGMVLGNVFVFAWLFVAMFLLANVYYLYINPLYKFAIEKSKHSKNKKPEMLH